MGDRSTEDDSICKARCLTDTRVAGIGSSELSKGTSSILNWDGNEDAGAVHNHMKLHSEWVKWKVRLVAREAIVP